MGALRLKSDISLTVCSWLSFLQQVSSVMVGEFSCYSVLTNHPTFLNKINVIMVVKVILELYQLDKHSRIIQERFIPYIYLCL